MIFIAIIIVIVSFATLIAIIRDDRRHEKERLRFQNRISSFKSLEETDLFE